LITDDGVFLLRDSMDNLRMLKILHDTGYNVKKMGLWARYYSHESVGGMDLFIDAIQKVFGHVESIEDPSGGYYEVQKLKVRNKEYGDLFHRFTEKWILAQLTKWKVTSSEHCGSEMIIDYKSGFFVIEFHEIPAYFSDYLDVLVKIKESIEKMSVLALPQKFKGGNKIVQY